MWVYYLCAQSGCKAVRPLTTIEDGLRARDKFAGLFQIYIILLKLRIVTVIRRVVRNHDISQTRRNVDCLAHHNNNNNKVILDPCRMVTVSLQQPFCERSARLIDDLRH